MFSLIGPKRFDAPWKDIEAQGYIAPADCVEVRVTLPDAERLDLRRVRAGRPVPARVDSAGEDSGGRARSWPRHRGEPTLVIGQYLDQLDELAERLDAHVITGETPVAERERLYQAFRAGEIDLLVVCKVANFSIDLPEASVAIQVSGAFGSRQEEAQRLGRLLRPKETGAPPTSTPSWPATPSTPSSPRTASASWPSRATPTGSSTPTSCPHRLNEKHPDGIQDTPRIRHNTEKVTTALPEARLLVVEDEPNIRELLATSLRFAGFEVHVAGDGATALNLASANEIDLVVLDVMLPDMDGFTVTRKLRDSGRQLPIVFVTARDSVDDKIKGLTVGGDDYVTKPFSLEEVVARIRAVLRRTRGERDDSAALRFEDLELDEDSHEVLRAGRPIDVSPTEFKLLRYLMLNPNRVLSKAQILDHVWDYDFRGESGIVESYISYLRRKIDVDGVAPLIHTKRGVGYVLRRPPGA